MDTAGYEDFSELRESWMQKKDGLIFVFSVVDRQSFEEL